MDVPERRKYPRYGFQTDAEIEWGSTTFRALVTDLSEAGMFIVATNPLWVGAMFSARLLLDQPVGIECAVRRVLPGKGMGVEFIKLSDEARARLQKLLGQLTS